MKERRANALEDDGPVDRALRGFLIGGAAIVYGLFLGLHLPRAEGFDPVSPRTLALFGLVGAPFAFHMFLARLEERPVLRGFSVLPLAALQISPFLFLELEDPREIIPALVVLAQGNLLASARRGLAAGISLSLPPVFVLVQMSLAPGPRWLLAFPVSICIALAALLFLDLRETRRWVAERMRSPLSGVGPERLESGPWGRGEHVNPARLSIYATLLAFLVLALVPFFYLPLLLLPEPHIGSTERGTETQPRLEIDPGVLPPARGSRTRSKRAFDGLFPREIDFSGGAGDLQKQSVMEVTPVDDRRRSTAYYLRGVVLDTVQEYGVSLSRSELPPQVLDAQDGRRDGWTRLHTPAAGESLELRIRQRPLRTRHGGASVVFGPRPVHSIELGAVLHDPDAWTGAEVSGEEWFEYGLRCGAPRKLPRDRDTRVSARYLQLPRSPVRIEAIRSLAHSITHSARSDLEKVQAVVDYFRENFEYSLVSTEFPGLVGVIEFLQRRSGHCTYYATSATLLLRAVGIPTRIATGFLADEWSEEDGFYPVSTRNGHAWIEVAFDEAGWVTFDPTPGEARAAVLGIEGRDSDTLGALAARLYDNFEQWIATGDKSYMQDFARGLAEAPGRLWASLIRRPWLSAGLLLLSLALFLALRGRAPLAAGGRRPIRRSPEGDLYARLLRALEPLGWHKGDHQTPREFARAVVSSGASELGPFAAWTERLYRARYGEEALDRDEVGAMEGFVQVLEALGQNP